MPKIDLLPCPFCGKVEALRMERIPFVYNLVCAVANGGCGASTGWNHATPEEAAKAWNTRASGWIPCSKRMPEKTGYYLCYTEDGDIFNALFDEMIDDDFQFGEWQTRFDPYTLGAIDDEWIPYDAVTHWMTLPEPPKGESK